MYKELLTFAYNQAFFRETNIHIRDITSGIDIYIKYVDGWCVVTPWDLQKMLTG